MKKISFIFMIFLLCATFSTAKENILRLATTTSTYETGLLDYIVPPFEQKNNLKVHIISVGTGKAIKLGKNGDVDVILVHARKAEEKFVKEGFGVKRFDVMYNDFIIAGPKTDPANIKNAKTIKEVMKKLYNSNCIFVSRGDDSGTHKKEKHLWEIANLVPTKSKTLRYLEAGQGMSATLRIADEKDGYVLVDRASYLFAKNNIKLVIDFENAKELLNYYGVIAVNPEKHSHINFDMANKFIKWLRSDKCQEMINNYKVNGQTLFKGNR